MPLLRLPLAVITIGALLIIAIFNLVSNHITFILWTYRNFEQCSFILFINYFAFCFFSDVQFSPELIYTWVMHNVIKINNKKYCEYCKNVKIIQSKKILVCRTRSSCNRLEIYVSITSSCFQDGIYNYHWLWLSSLRWSSSILRGFKCLADVG